MTIKLPFEQPTNIKKFILFFLIKRKWQTFLIILTSLSWSVQESLLPYFIKKLSDIIFNINDPKNLFILHKQFFLISLIIYIIIEICPRIYDYIAAYFYPRLCEDIRQLILDYSMHHSHDYYSQNFAGNIASKISRLADNVKLIVEKVITLVIPIIGMIIISTCLLAKTQITFAALTIIWIILHLIFIIKFSPNAEKYAETHAKELNFLGGKLVDILSNINIVRIFANQKYESKYFKENQLKEVIGHQNSLFYNAKLNLILGINTLIYGVLTVIIGLWCWQHRYISSSDLILIIGSLYLIGLVWYCGHYLVVIYNWLGTSTESLSIINIPHQVSDLEDAQNLVVEKGCIKFEKVGFAYLKNNHIFANKNILIPGGQKVGLVGLSGSGKTTFTNLILRLFDIIEGQILIDDQDIKHVTLDSLRNNIAFIPQDPHLFHRTVYENIRYGNIDASYEEVINASKKSRAHEFISKIPYGYETEVGERGIKLSGGQRQRIAIARAILKNSKIMILDEATSALDSITENEIKQNLELIGQDKTMLVIAHRLSTLINMDRILVFDCGDIVEDGTHQELLNKKGFYYKLWSMQIGGFLPDIIE